MQFYRNFSKNPLLFTEISLILHCDLNIKISTSDEVKIWRLNFCKGSVFFEKNK